MRVLIACEFSQIICIEFRKRGHKAFSCDLLPCEGGYSKWHIQDDILKHLNDGWDLMIAHPPCTYLCRTGVRWLYSKSKKHIGRWERMQMAAAFFKGLLESPIPQIAIENPVPYRYATNEIGRKYDQIIKPWQFGHDYSKKICLWLKNLPKLQPTKIVEITYITTPSGKRYTRGWYERPRKGKGRSITFQGIANAMAEQWGNLLI